MRALVPTGNEVVPWLFLRRRDQMIPRSARPQPEVLHLDEVRTLALRQARYRGTGTIECPNFAHCGSERACAILVDR